MPAKSKAQKRLMTWALGVKSGKAKTTSKKVKDVAKSMSMKELQKYSKTKGELPEKVTESAIGSDVVTFDAFRSKKVSKNSRFFEGEEKDMMKGDEIEMDDMEIGMMAPEDAEEGDDVLMNIKSPSHVTPQKNSHSYEWSEPESKMIQFQLKNIMEKVEELMQLFEGVEDVEDWIQAKMTVADNYITNVRDYMKHR